MYDDPETEFQKLILRRQKPTSIWRKIVHQAPWDNCWACTSTAAPAPTAKE